MPPPPTDEGPRLFVPMPAGPMHGTELTLIVMYNGILGSHKIAVPKLQGKKGDQHFETTLPPGCSGVLGMPGGKPAALRVPKGPVGKGDLFVHHGVERRCYVIQVPNPFPDGGAFEVYLDEPQWKA
jgi:hypothetical protein